MFTLRCAFRFSGLCLAEHSDADYGIFMQTDTEESWTGLRAFGMTGITDLMLPNFTEKCIDVCNLGLIHLKRPRNIFPNRRVFAERARLITVVTRISGILRYLVFAADRYSYDFWSMSDYVGELTNLQLVETMTGPVNNEKPFAGTIEAFLDAQNASSDNGSRRKLPVVIMALHLFPVIELAADRCRRDLAENTARFVPFSTPYSDAMVFLFILKANMFFSHDDGMSETDTFPRIFFDWNDDRDEGHRVQRFDWNAYADYVESIESKYLFRMNGSLLETVSIEELSNAKVLVKFCEMVSRPVTLLPRILKVHVEIARALGRAIDYGLKASTEASAEASAEAPAKECPHIGQILAVRKALKKSLLAKTTASASDPDIVSLRRITFVTV